MPDVRLTLEDLENEEKFALADPGDYIMQIVKIEETPTQSGPNAGTLRTWAHWEIVSNARGERTPMAGRRARQCLVGGWLSNFLQAVFGLTKDQIKNRVAAGEGFEITSENSVGKKAIATITNTPGKDNPMQKFNTIQTLRPLS